MERISVSRLLMPFPHVFHKGMRCINTDSIRFHFLHPFINAVLRCCGFAAAAPAAFE